MLQVFISHSAKDRVLVEQQLVPLLAHHSVGTWYSGSAIRTAALWENEIRLGLTASDWFLVVLSPHSGQSDWVKAEVQWALDKRSDRLVPVMIADCDPTETHLQLARYQYVDFRSNVASARSRLLSLWDRELQSERMLSVELEWHERTEGLPAAGQGNAAAHSQQLLIAGVATIGRHPSAEICLSDNTVSSRHAMLKVRFHEGFKSLWLVDLATSGVSVNGVQISMPVAVSEGDVIGIGDVEIAIGRITG